MKTKLILTALIAGFSLNIACSDSDIHVISEDELQGGLSLKLKANVDITPKISSDRSTKGISRDGNGDVVITTPDMNDFQITILSEDGQTVMSWDSYDDMPTVVRLKEGAYKLAANYGAVHSGGVFAEPRLEGTADFILERQKTNSVSVVCGVADVLVTVDYTEGFKNYFKDHTLTVYSDNKAFDITKGETRVACFNPGTLSTLLTVTQQNDKPLTLAPVVLTDAKGGEYYRLKFDVGEDGAGGTHLLLTFDDTTEEEPIKIELSAESLLNPFYTVDGFASGDVLELGEGEAYGDNLSALVTARAVIASCLLKTSSPELQAKGWPEDGFELVGMSDANKAKLKGFGFEWTESLSGLNMAVLNFKGMAEKMPAGLTEAKAHEIEVITTDKAGQESEPLTLIFNIIPPQFEITGYDLQPKVMTANNTTYYVEVTAGNPDRLFFEYFNPVWNRWYKVASSKGNHTNNRGWRFTVPDIDWSWASVRLRVGYEGREGHYIEKEIEGKLVNPTGTVAAKWSYSAVFRTTQTSADDKYYDPSHYSVKVSKDGKITWEDKPYTVYRDYNYTIRRVHFEVSGLESGTPYVARVTYDPKVGLPPTTGDFTIGTEAVLELPNGSFEQEGWSNTEYVDVNEGGEKVQKSFLGSESSYWVTTTITNHQVNGWANVNAKTIPAKDWLSANGRTVNSWYMVESMMPTTGYNSETGVLVRNVSWNNNGAAPPKNTGSGLSYNPGTPNAPGDDQFRTAIGKLFLSESGYSYDHDTDTETYNSRIPFTARPAKLKGYYKYVPVGADQGLALVQVLRVSTAGAETVLGQGSLSLTNAGSYTSFEVPITYSNISTAATHIRVMFAASDKASEDYTVEETAGITTSHDNFSHFYKSGSSLYIDELELEYQ